MNALPVIYKLLGRSTSIKSHDFRGDRCSHSRRSFKSRFWAVLEATKKVINTFSALCLDNQICLTLYEVLGVICTFEANYGAIEQSILHRLLYSEGGATKGGLGGSYQAPFRHMQTYGRCFYMSF